MQCFFVSRETSSAGDDLGIGGVFRNTADTRQAGSLCRIMFAARQKIAVFIPQEEANASPVGVTYLKLGEGEGLHSGNRLIFHGSLGTCLDPLDGRKTVLHLVKHIGGGYDLPVASLQVELKAGFHALNSKFSHWLSFPSLVFW